MMGEDNVFKGKVDFSSRANNRDHWSLTFHKENRRVLIMSVSYPGKDYADQSIVYSLYQNDDRIGGGGGMDIGRALYEALSWLER